MEFLKTLGIEGINPGTSTGQVHLESKDTISSLTPVDNSKIADVTVTSREQYEK
ncbi:MAG: aldehyde dehydrogenase family protein, partial [Gammaproteobacteria bacterium]|nr:aldehyde dehydrogenase family protein [Gammaproteobacteria bacterium]NIU08662.1 aldehyde dehydrogenase family protein [Phycisphaerae bacterium]